MKHRKVRDLQGFQRRVEAMSLYRRVREYDQQERKARKMRIIIEFIRGIGADPKVRFLVVALLGAVVAAIARQLGVEIP